MIKFPSLTGPPVGSRRAPSHLSSSVIRWNSSHRAGTVRGKSARRRPLAQAAPLLLGRASPDAGVLPGVQRPAQAWRPDRAVPAYLLGRLDLRQGRAQRADREEQLGVQTAAGGVVTPVRALGPR